MAGQPATPHQARPRITGAELCRPVRPPWISLAPPLLHETTAEEGLPNLLVREEGPTIVIIGRGKPRGWRRASRVLLAIQSFGISPLGDRSHFSPQGMRQQITDRLVDARDEFAVPAGPMNNGQLRNN